MFTLFIKLKSNIWLKKLYRTIGGMGPLLQSSIYKILLYATAVQLNVPRGALSPHPHEQFWILPCRRQQLSLKNSKETYFTSLLYVSMILGAINYKTIKWYVYMWLTNISAIFPYITDMYIKYTTKIYKKHNTAKTICLIINTANNTVLSMAKIKQCTKITTKSSHNLFVLK